MDISNVPFEAVLPTVGFVAEITHNSARAFSVHFSFLREGTTSSRRRNSVLEGWTSLILSSNLTDFLQPSLNPSLACLRRIDRLNGLHVRSVECVCAIDPCGILLRNIGSIAYLGRAPGAGRGGLWWTPTSYGREVDYLWHGWPDSRR